MKIFSRFFTSSLFALSILLATGCLMTSVPFQKDADIVRLRHLNYYGNLIEEYHQTTGKYPFEGHGDVPIYVFIANDQQKPFTDLPPSYAHEEISFEDFVKEIEKVLGREISEYYDPQYRPDYKPNFYIYMVREDMYFFAIHVHQPFSFAKKVADYYYKIELSNDKAPYLRAHTPKDLFSNPQFQQELDKPILKDGFFQERIDQYLHHTKTL